MEAKRDFQHATEPLGFHLEGFQFQCDQYFHCQLLHQCRVFWTNEQAGIRRERGHGEIPLAPFPISNLVKLHLGGILPYPTPHPLDKEGLNLIVTLALLDAENARKINEPLDCEGKSEQPRMCLSRQLPSATHVLLITRCDRSAVASHSKIQ